MSILSAQTIRNRFIIDPCLPRTIHNGTSYGLGPSSYDVRIREDLILKPQAFSLASTLERFSMPPDVCAFVKDKSTWARRGLSAFNTFIDPGWCGYLTLELVNHSDEHILLSSGDPIVQIVFMQLDQITEQTYSGKYQNQGPEAIGPKTEGGWF